MLDKNYEILGTRGGYVKIRFEGEARAEWVQLDNHRCAGARVMWRNEYLCAECYEDRLGTQSDLFRGHAKYFQAVSPLITAPLNNREDAEKNGEKEPKKPTAKKPATEKSTAKAPQLSLEARMDEFFADMTQAEFIRFSERIAK